MAVPVPSADAQRDRREWQNFKKFKALIAAPGNLATGVAMPAAGDVYVSTTSVLAAKTVLVTVKGVDKWSPAAAANARDHVQFVERAVQVKKKAGAPGTVSAYVRNPLGKLFLFASG